MSHHQRVFSPPSSQLPVFTLRSLHHSGRSFSELPHTNTPALAQAHYAGAMHVSFTQPAGHTHDCSTRNNQSLSFDVSHLTCQTRLWVDGAEWPGRICHSEGWCRPKRTRLSSSRPLKASDLWLLLLLHPESSETGAAAGPSTLPAQWKQEVTAKSREFLEKL